MMCFVSYAPLRAVYLFGRKLSVTFLTSEVPLRWESRKGSRRRRRLSARQTAALSPLCFSALSLNEQVHRELRRVEAAATTDNEPGTDANGGRRRRASRDPNGGRRHLPRFGLSARRPRPSVRACVTPQQVGSENARLKILRLNSRN